MMFPRRVRLGVVWAGVTGAVTLIAAIIAFAFSVQSAAQAAVLAAGAAQKAADEGPDRVLSIVTPRIIRLEADRDAALQERRAVKADVSAIRLHLCRECERTHRRKNACDDICMRAK